MFRTDYGVAGNPSAPHQEMAELVEELLVLDDIAEDPVGLVEMMDSYGAEIPDPSSIPIPEPEDNRWFDSFLEGNSQLEDVFFDQAPPCSSPYLGASSANHQQTWDYSHVMDWTPTNPVFGQHNPYVPNNGNMTNTNPQFQAVNGESSFRRLPEAGSKESRENRKTLLHDRRLSSNLRRFGIQTNEADRSTDGLQQVMGNPETFQRKDCKFLLQKVLVQLDVRDNPGGGRIMLAKKEAESNLPALDMGDRITMAMEEIGTSRVWSMCYRFLLHHGNRRMYVLENTGEYVRANVLRAGDVVVLYMDTKRGNYMIESLKDGQPAPKRKTVNVSSAAGTSGNASSSLVC